MTFHCVVQLLQLRQSTIGHLTGRKVNSKAKMPGFRPAFRFSAASRFRAASLA
jgi:hypothetical protein